MPWVRSVLVLLIAAGTAAADDWPQWLGPDRNASTKEKVAPWKEPPKTLWRKPVGEGHSSPVVADGRVYLHTRKKGAEEEVLQAFDTAKGDLLWEKAYPRAPYSGLFGNGPRATPTVANGRVYTFGITGLLTCFDAAKGDIVWQVNTAKEFQAPSLKFGASCSPLVVGNHVLVNIGAKGASIVAFDAAKGHVVWKALNDPASYASPITYEQGGQRQAVFLTANGLVSISPKSGDVFWQYPFKDFLLESSTTPVRAGDLLIGSSITRGTIGLKLTVTAGKPSVAKDWSNGSLTSYFSTPVPVGDFFYMVSGSVPTGFQKTHADLHCVDLKSGKSIWKKPRVGEYHASLLRTGDNKLLLLEEAGNLVLLDPSPKGYQELARATICGNTWAHAALSNGRLYIRDEKELICVQFLGG